ncbi:hypothetical protein BDP27DRAFT_1322866 [Rhodocollybia butyracea]|uniref:Uncharacterized protein n=1 Tax=Rhodocollybia butyracea TaxID=206335 RepID=A0A9P5PVW3_9AGAR|nr:hypothetical protein BDP27DRAFT_1322866 [Rhodocollybia butyracea]
MHTACLNRWTGTDSSLKPISLLHIKTSPPSIPKLPTLGDSWTHPPYSGFFDGTHMTEAHRVIKRALRLFC